jgi:hypothetical protein
MASLDQAIQYTQLFQDIELTAALQKLRQDPQAMQRFLQKAQDNLYKDVTVQKDGAFRKLYGDLEQATTTNHSLYYYHQRNEDLSKLQKEVYESRKGAADAVIHDRDLAKRQVEINQWSTGNKMDTLFIYQQLFLILCATCVLMFLWVRGAIGAPLFVGILLVLIAIFTFTVVERAQFTQFLRDGRYWNRRKFPTYSGIPMPNICGADISSMATDAEAALQQAEATATTQATSAYNQAQQDMQQGAQQVQAAATAATNFFNGL